MYTFITECIPVYLYVFVVKAFTNSTFKIPYISYLFFRHKVKVCQLILQIITTD